MPIASATEWIPLARAQSQVRAVPPDDELTDIVNAAVAWVEKRTDHPILDTTYRLLVQRPGLLITPYYEHPFFAGDHLPYTASLQFGTPDSPITVRGRGLRGKPTVRYWEPSQSPGEDPTGSIAPADLQRVENGGRYARPGESGALYNDPCIYPPETGWPAGLDNTPLVLEGSAGFAEVQDVPPQWRMAALQIVSALYDPPMSAHLCTRTAERLLVAFTRRGS